MAGLTGAKPSASYASLLRVNNNSDGIESALTVVTDGLGAETPLLISDAKLLVKDTNTASLFEVQTVAAAVVLSVDTTTSRVGIGTASPSAPLHVKETGTADMLLIESTDAGALSAPDVTLWRNSGTPQSSDVLGVIYFKGQEATSGHLQTYASIHAEIDQATDGVARGEMHFLTAGPSGGTNSIKMSILNNGNVGIGTDAPGYELHVCDSDGNAYIKVDSAVDSDSGIILAEADTNKWIIRNDGNASDILDVVDASGDGVYLPQDQSGANWTDSSDINLKTDIFILSDALTKVNKLRGVNYKWKKYKVGGLDPNTERDINRVGVIAQEVDEVLPEAVVKVKGDGNWGVQYSILIPLLIEAVKELSAKVTVLENA